KQAQHDRGGEKNPGIAAGAPLLFQIFQRNINFAMFLFVLGDPQFNHSFDFHIDGPPLFAGDYFHFRHQNVIEPQ
ncbi:MAG: hypothetical protein LBB75_05490, partial [Oscillospiraceae bacterium]|nr:hypothetical protein [Oscillospiraceae bacterium]